MTRVRMAVAPRFGRERLFRAFTRLLLRGRVAAGPFRGMKYVSASVGSAFLPKIFGTYERELWPALEQWRRAQLPEAIVIGAAEGYYAVGLLFSKVVCSVTAYESEAAGRDLCVALARKNQVDGALKVFGACDETRLIELVQSSPARTFGLLVDIEGGEAALFNPDVVAHLRRAYLIVELHENLAPGVTELLAKRFARSHTIEVLSFGRRGDPVLEGSAVLFKVWPDRYRQLLMNEIRDDGCAWMVLQPR